jgi:hypothetical protein
MSHPRIRLLFVLLTLVVLCGAAQATNLQITVLDSVDNTTISHATVYLSGSNIGMTSNAGQFLLESGQGSLALRVSKDGYYDWAGTVAGDTTDLMVILDRESLVLKVDLYDSSSLNPVSGATVQLSAPNVSQSKISDANGTVSFAVSSYTYYTLNISASNYEARGESVAMESADKELQYWLLSGNQYSFVVKDKNTQSAIEGATVSVDSVVLGKTDSRGVLIVPVTREKTLLIEVTKSGYQTSSESKTINTGEAIDSVYLTPLPVGAYVFVYDQQNKPVEGASVYIDKTLLGNTSVYGRASLQTLVSGTYSLMVKKSGYADTTQQISLSDNSTEFSVVIPLASADLTIYVQDTDKKNLDGATIEIGGTKAGTTDSHGQFLTQITYNTKYNITAYLDGYTPKSVEEEVSLGNASTSLTITLEKNFDWGFLTLIGIGVVVILFLLVVVRLASGRNRHRSSGGGRRDEI